jgi:hypothetical protein
MGNGFTPGRHLQGTSQVGSALRSQPQNETAVLDQLFLARSVRYNQVAIQNSMSRPDTWLETSRIKLRWTNR